MELKFECEKMIIVVSGNFLSPIKKKKIPQISMAVGPMVKMLKIVPPPLEVYGVQNFIMYIRDTYY